MNKAIINDLSAPKSDLEDESVESFFSRRLSPAWAARLVDPFISGIYAGDIRKLSIKRRFPLLHQLEQEHGSLIWGMIKRKKASSIPFVKAPFFSFKNGMETLIHALQDNLKENIRLNSEVIEWRETAVKLGTGEWLEAFHQEISQWLAKALHPRFKRPFTELVYQPMVEVMQLLRHHGFEIYIVSGGGQEFMRSFALKLYGIPPSHVIGTAAKVQYKYNNGHPELLKLPQILFVNDKEGKSEGINLMIGKRPVIAFGNSIGDQQMLEWTQGGKRKHFELLIHHDDAERRYAYGTDSKIGTFTPALMDEAKKEGWTVVSMKKDWKVIFYLAAVIILYTNLVGFWYTASWRPYQNTQSISLCFLKYKLLNNFSLV